MKLAVRILALASAALVSTAAFAASEARVNVPFDFTAKGHSFPAGSYNVLLDSNSTMVTLANRSEPGSQLKWTVGPADPASAPVVLKFDRIGETYALHTIQMQNRVTPSLDRFKGVSATTSISGQ